MKQQLENIRLQAMADLDAATTPAALEELRVRLLGKKGELTAGLLPRCVQAAAGQGKVRNLLELL